MYVLANKEGRLLEPFARGMGDAWPVTKMGFPRRTKRVNRAGSVDAIRWWAGVVARA